MEKSVINVEKCIEQINAMSKTDFHQKILRGVAASEEFSCLSEIPCSLHQAVLLIPLARHSFMILVHCSQRTL